MHEKITMILSIALPIVIIISFLSFMYFELRKYLIYKKEVKNRKFSVSFLDKKYGNPFSIVIVTPLVPVSPETAEEIYKIYHEFTKNAAKVAIEEYQKPCLLNRGMGDDKI